MEETTLTCARAWALDSGFQGVGSGWVWIMALWREDGVCACGACKPAPQPVRTPCTAPPRAPAAQIVGGGEEAADVAEHTGYRGEDTVAYRSTKARAATPRI